MGEHKNNVVISKVEYEQLQVRSIFLTALMTVTEDSPEITFWEARQAAEQLLQDKAAQTD